MNNLTKFKNKQQLSKKEAANVIGGIRFITSSHSEYKAKRKELMKSSTSFMEMVNHANDFYCIEW